MIFDPSTPTHIQDIKSSQHLYLVCFSLTRISSSLSYSHDYNPTINAHTWISLFLGPKWANALFSEIKHPCALILKLNREMPLFCNSRILKSSYMKYSILLWSSYIQVFPALLAFFFLNLYITRLLKNQVSYAIINSDFVLSLCQVRCFNITQFL